MSEVQKIRIKNYRILVVMLFIFPWFFPLLLVKKLTKLLSFIFIRISEGSDYANECFGDFIKINEIIKWAYKNDKKPIK